MDSHQGQNWSFLKTHHLSCIEFHCTSVSLSCGHLSRARSTGLGKCGLTLGDPHVGCESLAMSPDSFLLPILSYLSMTRQPGLASRRAI